MVVLEEIKDILKSMEPEDDFETETYKSALIDAFAGVRLPVTHPTESLHLDVTELPQDLGVDKPEVRQSIESSFERHKGGPQGEPQTATKEVEG